MGQGQERRWTSWPDSQCANRAQPTGIDGIALGVPNGVFHPVEPPCDQGVDHRHGIAGVGEGGRPVEMEQAGSFNEYEQLLGLFYPLLKHGQQLSQARCRYRQIFFQEQGPWASAQSGADFVFGGINAEEVE